MTKSQLSWMEKIWNFWNSQSTRPQQPRGALNTIKILIGWAFKWRRLHTFGRRLEDFFIDGPDKAQNLAAFLPWGLPCKWTRELSCEQFTAYRKRFVTKQLSAWVNIFRVCQRRNKDLQLKLTTFVLKSNYKCWLIKITSLKKWT